MHARNESPQRESPQARTSDPAPRSIQNVVIFTGSLQLYSVQKGIVELARAFRNTEWLILEHAPRRSILRLLRNQWRNASRNGWRWLPHQMWEIAERFVWRRHREAAAESVPGTQFTMSAMLRMPNVRHLKVEDVHGDDVLARVWAFEPDLGISLAAPILRPPLFEIPREGTINLHKGRLPDYRGMPPAFWEFVNGESEIGCTIHRVERGLDTGPILVEGTVAKSRYSTVRGVQLKLDELGVALTCDAVRLIRDGRAVWKSQGPGGRTYTKPTLRQLAAMERRSRDRVSGAWARRIGKEAFFRTYVQFARRMVRPLLGWLNRQRIVILLYHRVSDELRDSLTVGIEQFDAQMKWLSQHHPVVDISDIIHGRIPRDAARPVVAVTFDDGYLDNYEIAVPILLRHQVPAGFFVSTGMIGRNQGFPHDLKRLGYPLPTMSWENLRHMRELGFTVGSHTVTHLDCGSADLETVRRELIESRDALRQKLGLDEVILAYPFGGRSNMNAAALQLVKELGYSGCLSAYGGHIAGRVDPYNIERVGIESNFTMLAFRAALEGFY